MVNYCKNCDASLGFRSDNIGYCDEKCKTNHLKWLATPHIMEWIPTTSGKGYYLERVDLQHLAEGIEAARKRNP